MVVVDGNAKDINGGRYGREKLETTISNNRAFVWAVAGVVGWATGIVKILSGGRVFRDGEYCRRVV